MRLFGTSSKRDRRHIVILDIGSGSVGGALCAIAPGKMPEIRFVSRKPIVFQEHLYFPRLLNSMRKTLAELGGELRNATGQTKIDRVHAVLASPWYSSQTRIVHYARPEQFFVTERGVAKLVEHEIGLFRSSKLFTKSKEDYVPPQIVEAKNIRIALNGYEVQNPFGKRATELDLALYISMVAGGAHAALRDDIAAIFPHVPVHFSSFSFTAFDTIRDMFVDESCFFFMDITGEATDLSIVNENVLLESVSFPFGTNTLLRVLTGATKQDTASAASELSLFVSGDLSPARVREIDGLLRPSLDEWSGFFSDALHRFAKKFPIPRVIFYTIDDASSGIFEDALKRTRFSHLGGEDHVFTARHLGMKFLGKFTEIADPNGQDPFIAIEAIAAKKLALLGT